MISGFAYCSHRVFFAGGGGGGILSPWREFGWVGGRLLELCLCPPRFNDGVVHFAVFDSNLCRIRKHL